MAEWLKAHDSKSCMQQCIGGSNPLASAIILALRKRPARGLVFWVRNAVGRGYQDRTGDLTPPRRARYHCAKPRWNDFTINELIYKRVWGGDFDEGVDDV